MKRISLRLIAVLAALTLTLSAFAQLPFQDKTLSPEQRAADIVGRLTLEEKAALLRYDSPAVERLGIPAYNWWNEALHGVARNGNATVYPMPVAMASTFDPQHIEEVFTSVSDEARVKYRLARTVENPDNYWYKGLTFWTPNINIFRDPRWGRGMETYGEDPYLTGQLGMAVVRGLQGERENGSMKAQACAKHFAVHSGPESTRHSFDVKVSERDLRETYLPAFRDLVVKAKVDEVMFAYNRFEGYPCGASERLLKDILKDEWGFGGLIVSDCWAVSDFFKGHGWSDNPVEAIAAAINAGMDLECGALTPLAVKAVKEGLLDEATIDERLTKLFTVRFALGEMDFESPWDNIPEEVLCSESHSEQALDIARKSLVLLSNDGILPLKEGARIGLTGPNAADSVMMWGNYNGFPMRTVTLLDALKARIPELKYVKGCSHAAELDSTATDIEAVVKEFEDCDIVIFASGISPSLEGEEMPVTIPGFSGGDRTSIELPAIQKELEEFKQKDAGVEPYKEKYDELQKEFDSFKADVEAKATTAKKETAFRHMLKDIGIPDKRIDSVLKVSGKAVDDIELTDEGIKDEDTLKAKLKEEWSDFIATTKTEGVPTANPPTSTSKNTMTKEQIRAIPDAQARQKAMLENPSLFGLAETN